VKAAALRPVARRWLGSAAGLVCTLLACAQPRAIPAEYRSRSYDLPSQALESLAPRSGFTAPAPEPLGLLTLEQARQIALDRNPTIEAAAEAVAAAEARIAGPRSAFLPHASASVERDFRESPLELSLTGIGGVEILPTTLTRGSALVSQSLYSFGRDLASLRAAQADVSTEILSERAARQALLFAVSQAWYRLHEARSFESVMLDASKAAERQLADAIDLQDSQRVTEDAVLTARVNALDRKQSLLVARNAVKNSQRALNVLLALPETATLTLAPSPDFEAVQLDPSALLDLARRHNPGLLAFRTAALSLESRDKAVRRSYLPELFVAAGAEYYDLGDEETNLLAVVGVRWNPFSGGQRQGQRSALNAGRRELRSREEQATLDTWFAINQTVTDIAEQESAVDVASQAIEAATENQRVIAELFRAGRATSREALEAQVTLTNSRNLYNQARFAHRILLAKLELLVGVAQDGWSEVAR